MALLFGHGVHDIPFEGGRELRSRENSGRVFGSPFGFLEPAVGFSHRRGSVLIGRHQSRNSRRLECELQGCSDRFVSLEERGLVVVAESEALRWRLDDGRLDPCWV